jgi:hypothetical protein
MIIIITIIITTTIIIIVNHLYEYYGIAGGYARQLIAR